MKIITYYSAGDINSTNLLVAKRYCFCIAWSSICPSVDTNCACKDFRFFSKAVHSQVVRRPSSVRPNKTMAITSLSLGGFHSYLDTMTLGRRPSHACLLI